MKKVITVVVMLLGLVGSSYAQTNDGCESVLIYAGNSITTSLSTTEREAFHYMDKCTNRTKEGNLSIAYNAFKLGGGGSSSSMSCENNASLNNEALFNSIASKIPVQAAIEAWMQCQSLKAGRITPDITDTGNLVTVGIKNGDSTIPINVTFGFAPTDAYGKFDYSCQVFYQGVPVSDKIPFTQEVKSLERAALRCNRPLHNYTTPQGQVATIRPGGVVTIDTSSASYSMIVFNKDSSMENELLKLSQDILKSAAEIVRTSSVSLVNCQYPNDAAWWNAWDQPSEAQCPAGQVMQGYRSEHNNHFEDRLYKFKCCSISITPGG